MNFSDDGEFLATASEDETVHIYNCQKGTMMLEISCKKYGADLIHFTHHNQSVLVASRNEIDRMLKNTQILFFVDTIRYLSLHDNRYLRYFKGHRSRVVSLDMSPHNDTFASAGLDDTVRFWDLNSNACKGLLRVKGRATVAFDPKHEHVFAVGFPFNNVKLFDDRYFDKGPFETYLIDANPFDFIDLRFSPMATQLLISTNKNALLLDAMKGTKVLHKLSCVVNNSQIRECFETDSSEDLKACFSPDEQFLMCGTEDGKIITLDNQTGQKIFEFSGHVGPVCTVAWNPKYAMFASACSNLSLWVPTQQY